MKYIDYAKMIATHFPKNKPVETSIDDISGLLKCSERHTKTVLNYLDQREWIRWDVQRGRGKKPKITLLLDHADILFEEAVKLSKEEHYQKAFQIVQRLNVNLQEKFQGWLKTNAGIFKTNSVKEQELDILKYPFYETNLVMDPIFLKSRHDGHMVQQIYDRLVEYDSKTDQLTPQLAHHWESTDGVKWTFYLRKCVLFHDGKVLTARDVRATIERLGEDDVITQNIDRIEIINQTVIVFHLNETNFLFPRYLANLKVSIIPSDVLEKDQKALLKHPIGTGPFQLIRNDDDLIRLDVFENYFGYRPWLDRVEIIKVPDKFDSSREMPLFLYAPDDSWDKITTQEEGADYIIFNCRKQGPMSDESLRKWTCEQINAEEFCLAREMVAHSLLTQRSLEFKSSNGKRPTEEKSPQLTLKIAAQQIRKGANHEREALIFQQQLNKIGVDSSVEAVPIHQLIQPDVLDQYDIVVGGVALSDDHLLSVLTTLQSNRMVIYPCLSDELKKEVNDGISMIKENQNTNVQWDIYFKVEEYLKSEHAIFFLSHRTHTIYQSETSPYMGIELDSHGRVDYRNVWKRQE
ncbi:ABC transporter substrate-binding protein [Alkalibacillus aidingensis]|uniref:ABC transporter substrate-binding protein n=1 Tax=Alkalibacillus aidingensis TaxID=2747607 RepID=UPI001660EA40|nr:ABC transporter substrate-binding protein [Alkalibacillus aidingensis]